MRISPKPRRIHDTTARARTRRASVGRGAGGLLRSSGARTPDRGDEREAALAVLDDPVAERRAEQDDGEEERADLRGELHDAEDLRAAFDERQHERADRRTDRMRAAQQRRRETREHQIGGERAVEAVRGAQDVRQTHESGDGAGGQERGDDAALDRDAGGLRGIRRQVRHGHGVAPDRPVVEQEEPDAEEHGQRQEAGDLHATPEVQQHGHGPVGSDRRRTGVLPAAGAEDVRQ
ncbi:MAG: hypothetical protein J0I95_08300 [Microbacterium sp.]|nr:hypothetical protein [Microbacterium sp.]MBN9211497.1 hypothetical protein [Microbacterium sp.]